MKKLFTLAALAVAFQFANAQTQPAPKTAPITPTRPTPVVSNTDKTTQTPAVKTGEEPAFKWAEETFDFGTIPQGVPVTHEFTFTNTGKSPLVISKVDKSCGCTTPKWTSEPVMPGKTGTVSATFNAASPGGFNKTVTVHSNAGDKVLYIKGTVKAKEQTTPATEDHSGHKH